MGEKMTPTMGPEQLQAELGRISARLQEDGVPPSASSEERQCFLWQQLLRGEAMHQSATQELQTLRTQQAGEMKEVESYVAHIRGLLEERECLTADYERDNEHLRHEIHQLRQQQESQSKELAEMLAQEDLGEIGLSSPSEQVAYLLVERATLLERLEATEPRLESHSLPGGPIEGQHQAHSEEISQERKECQRVERDLEEASRRLSMAHQDIRRLTDELDLAKNNNLAESSDSMKLQHTKQKNDTLHAENTALRERIRTIECEKKMLQEKLALGDQDVGNGQGTDSQPPDQEKESVHKRCHEAIEDGLVQARELRQQLQRLRRGQEELEERNEELEALLGEAQNASKEDRHRHEGELEGLHRRIKSLEAELKRLDCQEKNTRTTNSDQVKATESYLPLHLRDGGQERFALLEARLTEEKDWRKQLEVDLSAAQASLKKEKGALQTSERELKKLRLEVNSLQTECQQGKTLIKSLTQVKGEKAVLEEKVAQMERAHGRLQSELESCRRGDGTQEELKGSRLQVDQLQEQADRLAGELGSLQTAHNTLRAEMVSERLRSAELHTRLSSSIQEKLQAEGARERAALEIQRLGQQSRLHQEQLESSKRPAAHADQADPAPCPADASSGESLVQLSWLKQELNNMKTKLREERQLASQHQLALQAQIVEAQALIKSQDSVMGQKAEEARQTCQDLQRAQGLFTSAERELRYEKERNADLKRHNNLLEQEKLKLSAELNQAQTKLGQAEQAAQTQAAELERQQQRVREAELELARSSVHHDSVASLQEDLQATRVQLIAADKKVLELQQKLKVAQHQLRVEEARAGESGRLERDSRDLSDTLSALRAQQHEEQITRKLLEHREEELQQQVRSLRLMEASFAKTNAELGHRAQQLDTRLVILEAELSKSREEARNSQKTGHRLQEELAASQQKCDRQQGELQEVLLHLDSHVRKFNQKHSRHKIKLRQAKQVYLKATAQRDCVIQKLENDLVLASRFLQKESERITTVMEENEKLLKEKRELLRKIGDAEEMCSNGMRKASTVQHRVNVLEVENGQLQERSLKLSNQVSSLERALRNTQICYSLENAMKMNPPENLCEGILPASMLRSTSSSCEKLDHQDKICAGKAGERTGAESPRPPVPGYQLLEQGYLNLTSPLAAPESRGQEGPVGGVDKA